MVSFAKELSHQDAADIRAYVVFRRNQSVAQKTSAAVKTKQTLTIGGALQCSQGDQRKNSEARTGTRVSCFLGFLPRFPRYFVQIKDGHSL
jgi:hypothetical protein